MSKRMFSTILAVSVLLAGCMPKELQENVVAGSLAIGTHETSAAASIGHMAGPVISDDGLLTVADVKKTYGMKDTIQIKPFYNVEQDTKFVFTFNAEVEPCHAVTVHTDPACGINSMVYQINDGYRTFDGRTKVVVKPGHAVLQCDQRVSNVTDDYNWGNAPIYYLCIRYDMEASSPQKLQEPVIVPFTVRSEVSVPTVRAGVYEDGSFYIAWNPVEGAVQYNIYEANRVRESSEAYDMSRAEAGFVGDHLQKLATVDASTLEFSDFSNDGSGNTLMSYDGYVQDQNFFELGSYYVTAVDAAGNESFFSYPISGWQFGASQPKTFDSFAVFGAGNATHLPETVPVQMADGSTAYLPINYHKLAVEYGVATYEYDIAGTKLTGTVRYESPSWTYEEEILSKASIPSGLYDIHADIPLVPANDVKTIIEEGYSADYVLSGNVNIKDAAMKLDTSYDARLLRADLENARIVTDGIYTQDPFESIPTYLDGGSVPVVPDDTAYVDETAETAGTADITETAGTDKSPGATEAAEPGLATEATETAETAEMTEMPGQTEASGLEEAAGPSENVQVIDQSNLVDEQIESTRRQVEEGNNVQVQQTGYPVFADSAEEAYMAMCMINGDTVIDIRAFPGLQDTDHLLDVMYKIIFQNPYVMSVSNFGYSPEYQAVAVEYDLSRDEILMRQAETAKKVEEVTAGIITPGMSDEEKVEAVWTWLEQNTQYDNDALAAAETSGFADVSGHADAFNVYGILCKGIGVCQSYSYAFHLLCDAAGVNCVTLTGYLNRTLPHGWNAVELDGRWYWVDATNNANVVGFPYYLYQASSDFAAIAEYVLDDRYALDDALDFCISSDNSKDPYFVNGLVADNDAQLAGLLAELSTIAPAGEMAAVKCNYTIQPDTDAFYAELYAALVAKGFTEEEMENMRMGYLGGYYVLIHD